jgi:putative ABC transport system permease protein
MDSFIHDARYAIRKLLRTPGFTITAIVTLALGIGATTAMWAIVDGVLLKPLPYRNPDALVRVASVGREGKPTAMSAPDFVDYRDQSHSFVGMAGIDNDNENLTRAGSEPVRINVAQVGASFFDLLGLAPQSGRFFRKGEDARGAVDVVVLSDVLWRSRFGSDTSIIGRPISLNGVSYTVVGIAGPRFSYPDRAEAWRPFVWQAWQIDPGNRGAHFMAAIGRVKPGVSIETAKLDVATIAKQLAAKYPDSNSEFAGTIEPLQQYIVGSIGNALEAMLGAVIFVLLIACANVANLLLVRGAARETEIAVRTALGAARRRIIRQLVTESALLALTGAALGVGVATWMLEGVRRLAGEQIPRLESVSIDLRALGFAVAAAVVTGILFGLAPAVHAARSGISQMLRSGARGVGSQTANRTRNGLVIVELALAMVLLIGAGLLARSFSKLLSVDLGFTPDRVVTFNVALPDSKYPYEPKVRAFVARAIEGLRLLPGTQSAGAAFGRPFENRMMRTSFDIQGRAPVARDKRMLSLVSPTTPDYFKTMGIQVKAGRVFEERENGFNSEPVLVINDALARKYFPNENPIGQTLALGIGHDTAPGTKPLKVGGKIIGIVSDVKQLDLKTDVLPATYIPFNTLAMSGVSFVIRTSAPLSAIATPLRAGIRQLDGELPIFGLQTMDDAISGSMSQPRFFMALLAGFSMLALVLAAIGIYGVISYAVAQRTREMGIRIALGATQQRVVKLVVSQGAMLAVGGVTLGVVGAVSLTRLISNLLFLTPPLDPVTFAGVAALLGSIAVLAAYLPARRAASVDPVIAMRAE